MTIRVRQLCGGGLYREPPFWTETIWFGVRFATAWRWLKGLGWRHYFVHDPLYPVSTVVHAPLRLRLKGRCWVEDVALPAILQPDAEQFAIDIPPLPREPKWEPYQRATRRTRKADPDAVRLGRKGGKARAAKLSHEERSRIAKDAARRRWDRQPKDTTDA